MSLPLPSLFPRQSTMFAILFDTPHPSPFSIGKTHGFFFRTVIFFSDLGTLIYLFNPHFLSPLTDPPPLSMHSTSANSGGDSSIADSLASIHTTLEGILEGNFSS